MRQVYIYQKKAYNEGDIETLRQYRSRPLPGITNPGKDDFLQCVMYPGFDENIVLDYRFCPFHEKRVREYYKVWN